MAELQQVKNYTAQWLELGKAIQIGDHSFRVGRVRGASQYSWEFEQMWQKIMQTPEQAYLENCALSIADLLSPQWEITPCPRCYGNIPSPLANYNMTLVCPCADMPNLPNLNLVMPHPPVPEQKALARLHDRLSVTE